MNTPSTQSQLSSQLSSSSSLEKNSKKRLWTDVKSSPSALWTATHWARFKRLKRHRPSKEFSAKQKLLSLVSTETFPASAGTKSLAKSSGWLSRPQQHFCHQSTNRIIINEFVKRIDFPNRALHFPLVRFFPEHDLIFNFLYAYTSIL